MNNDQLITVHLHLPTGTNYSEGGLQYVVWADVMLMWRQRYVPRGRATTTVLVGAKTTIQYHQIRRRKPQQSHNV